MKAVQSFVMCIVLLFGAAVLTAQAPEWKWGVAARGVFRVEGQSVALDTARLTSMSPESLLTQPLSAATT